MERRNFIRTVSAGMLAGMLMPGRIYANFPSKHTIGLQLYTLRNEIKENLEESLEKIAAIGYKNLEAAGYSDGKFYGLEPAAFKSMVNKLGMKLIGSHMTFAPNEISTVLNAHKEAGVKYLVWPWIGKDQRQQLDDYKKLADEFNTIGELCNDNGLKFGYHNHDFEFYPINGQVPYDLLLDLTDPELVFMELDLYWIIYAGKDPLEYFEKYPGRFELWHVKDMKAGESKKMIEVGAGIIDYPAIFEQTALAGMKEYFVEQDVIEGDGFESIKQSFEYLNNNI